MAVPTSGDRLTRGSKGPDGDDALDTHAHLAAAERRDAIADDRDVAALARDAAAAARDTATDAPVSFSERETRGRGRSRAAEQRSVAAQHRAEAAEQRVLAAEDRRVAAQDRELLVRELEREQRRLDQALRHQHRAEQLADTLQRSLSPPSLPLVAGLDVAVHYEPFAAEDVGGDFYDLFPLPAGRSGFFLGDVCGKGPDAAAVTSLARYTMRTAAMLREQPDAILADLNAALLMDDSEPSPMCTAVYGEIDTQNGPASVILAVAGHPAPLIVRASGNVEVTPARGTILGAIEDPAFRTCAVVLNPGDAIVIYSDGILDAEIDGSRVDEQRIEKLLSGTASGSAQDLVDRLRCALRGTDRPLRDDVAIMALRRTSGG